MKFNNSHEDGPIEYHPSSPLKFGIISIALLAMLASCATPAVPAPPAAPDIHDKGSLSLDCSKGITKTQIIFTGLINEDYVWVDQQPPLIGDLPSGIKVTYQNYVNSSSNKYVTSAELQIFGPRMLGNQYYNNYNTVSDASGLTDWFSRQTYGIIDGYDNYTKTISISLQAGEALSNTLKATITCEKQ